jgi:DNA-binding response OmpR family regulator
VRILVVDDSEDSRELTEAALLSAGFPDIAATASGGETLKFLEVGRADDGAAPVDIVLLDIVMQEMDGIEVCARVRNDPRYADLPIIMLTSLDDTSSLANAFAAGATDYVTKPVDPVELTARMRAALRRKEELDQQTERLRVLTDEMARMKAPHAAGDSNVISRTTAAAAAAFGAAAPNLGREHEAPSRALKQERKSNGAARNGSIEVVTSLEKNKFRARLQLESGKLEAIRIKLKSSPAAPEDFDELHVVVHKLAGAAAIFGFDGVSLSAAELEQLIIDTKSDGRPPGSIDGEVAGLLRVIAQAVQCTQ